MAGWTATQPKQDGLYWFLEPNAGAPTIVKLKWDVLSFMDKDWDYEPPPEGSGELFWSEPLTMPSEPAHDVKGKWTSDWPDAEGLYWTFDPAMGVKLAQFSNEGRAYLGTDDYGDCEDRMPRELFWPERIIAPAIPVGLTSLRQ